MTVCFLTWSAGWGGVEVYTGELANMLRDRGHKVFIAELGHSIHSRAQSRHETGVAFLSIPLPRPLHQLGLWESLRLLWSVKADVAIGLYPNLQFPLDGGNFWFDLAARLRFNRYIVVHQWMATPMPQKVSRRHFGNLLPGIGWWWYRLALPHYLRSLPPHRIICGSDAIRVRLIHDYLFSETKTITIHNGIDADLFRPNTEYRRSTRAAWGLSQDAVVFGTVGRLSNEKGHAALIQAFRELIASLPSYDLRLVLVGQGPAEPELRRAVREATLQDRVLLTGFIDRHWEAFAAFDVFVLPSLVEGFPLALLEAMASGCAPIATAVGGVPELLNNEALGWLVPPGDYMALCSAMTAAALARRESLMTIGNRARKRVLEGFNARIQFSEFIDVIEREFTGSFVNVFRRADSRIPPTDRGRQDVSPTSRNATSIDLEGSGDALRRSKVPF